MKSKISEHSQTETGAEVIRDEIAEKRNDWVALNVLISTCGNEPSASLLWAFESDLKQACVKEIDRYFEQLLNKRIANNAILLFSPSYLIFLKYLPLLWYSLIPNGPIIELKIPWALEAFSLAA